MSIEKHALDDDREIKYQASATEEADLPMADRYAWFEEEKKVYTDALRDNRNSLLTESDWTQVVDSPLTDAKKEEWRLYRETLRNITDQYWKQSDVVWPAKP